MLLKYLMENYKTGEPIFLTDIDTPEYTEENLRYHFKKLTDDGILCRFEPGVYFFPKANILGNAPFLSIETVVLHKYINRKGQKIGIYSGYTLANRMGLTTQVPFTEEITSNNAPAPVRELKIKNRKYIIRKPAVPINNDNCYALQLLECLKDLDKCAEENNEICGKILSGYITDHNITKSMIDSLIGSYPLKTYKAIYETGILNVFA